MQEKKQLALTHPTATITRELQDKEHPREHTIVKGRNPKTNRMNNSSDDQHYNLLIGNLRDKLKYLASKISEKVYEYEFLKR